MGEDLREDPGADEEPDRGPERSVDPEEEDEAHRRPELERSERQRGPPRLVREQAVVHENVESQRGAEHRSYELDGPPGMEHEAAMQATTNGTAPAARRDSTRPLRV